MNLFIEQQRLKTHLRRDAIDFIYLPQQAQRVDILRQQTDPGRQSLRLKEALLAPAENVWMRFDADIGVGMLATGSVQHAGKGFGIRQPKTDAQIVARLIQHKNTRSAPIRNEIRGSIRRMVILAQVVSCDGTHGCACLVQQVRGLPAFIVEQVFQSRRASRVIIDARIVQDQRIRRGTPDAEIKRAQESVFQTEQREPALAGGPFRRFPRGFLEPPGKKSVAAPFEAFPEQRYFPPARQPDNLLPEKGGQMRNPFHAAGEMSAESLFRGTQKQ